MTDGTGKPSSLTRASFFALLAVCQLALGRACTPAVLWCSHESLDYDAAYRAAPSSPLQKVTSEEFEKSLSQFNVTEPAVITEELCIEDLRNSKVLSNATNGSKIVYFPCVDTPDTVLLKVYKQIKVIEDINDDHEFNMVLKDIDSSGCILLTGKQCRYSHTERIKREALADNSTEFKIKTNKVLLYSAKPLSFKAPDKDDAVQLESKAASATSRTEKETTILTIKFTNVEEIGSLTLEFYFVVKSIGYYTLKNVTYDIDNKINVLSTMRDISFPFGFSYHCSPETAFVNSTTSYLKLTEMQVQVDHKNATFSDAYDCVGFTSIPIWMGIFVTVILGLIMIWALIMIMDIHTMDKFDDPKGKTITISSAE
ncbi:uncharacterized protein LOC105193113 [Solenopsis invicta]|uniref:uncharacterized protein LOC105193113 n=1 Tax=Solenopsis invicta TaxID=13686 RepID=UPI00193DE85C|nr:uncharacterized protein LOC105193113 [Solenopsis invicta]